MMKKLFFLLLTVMLFMNGFAQSVIDPFLGEEMTRRSDDEKIDIIVIMKAQYDRAQLNRRADWFPTRAERREFVVNELKEFANASQYDLRHSLAEMERMGMVSEPRILWIANAMGLSANKTAINDLAQRNDILIIGYDVERNWIPDGEEASPALATREITQNVTQVNADDVWALGYTGEGVVVAVIDTGVNYNHLDVADHLWDGGSEFPHHGYDVYNNDNDPMDDMGHGSHCAGTVCGDGTAGSQTGMAPNATLMCVKCLNSQGGGGATPIAAGIQWAVEHGCDLFSMSLGIANSTVAERTLLRHTCVSALDAGVVAAIAAGNEGNQTWQAPIPNNVRVPGSCPPPYMDEVQGENPGDLTCSVCIGAVNYNDAAANFTSRGPVTWTNTEFGDYPYNPGIGLIRPDVCAPGVDIKSLNYATNTGYTTMSGTSMATPCAAGCMALMLSKDPSLSPADVCRILEETAVRLAEGKSNTFGFGRIDVLAAVEAIQLGAIRYNTYAINDPEGNNNHRLNPGESVTMDLTLDNVTDAPVSNVSVVLSTENAHVNITDNTVDFSGFAANQSLTVADAFAFTVDDQVVANERILFSIEISVDGEVTAHFNIHVNVYDYLLQYGTTVVLNDDNADGLLNPGETADLRILVDNAGNELAQMVVGTLSTDYGLVTLNETEKPYSTIGADMMAYADFNVTLDAAAPEDFEIPFTLDLVDAFGRHTVMAFNYKNACNIIFSLVDSYGDGWQGNYLTVAYSDGTPTEQMTVSSGSTATYIREVASGSTISLTWHNGQWTSECSFEIKYEDGTVIYQNAGGFNGTQTFTINCGGGSGALEFCNPIQNLAYEMVGLDVVLSWEAPVTGTPSGYEIYRETELLGEVQSLTFTDPNVAEGLYTYCVYAVYNDCQSEFVCAEVEVSFCGVVQNLDYALNDDLLLTLTWNAPEDPSGLIEYQVYMDDELVATTNELTYAFTIAEGQHDVAVNAVFQSCEKDVHIPVCVVGAVQNLDCKIEGDQANVTWDALEGVDQYEVYIDGALAATVDEPAYTFEAEPGVVSITVKAVAESCYVLGANVEACYIEPVADLRFVAINYDGIGFAWDAVPDVEYYLVTYNDSTVQLAPSDTEFSFVPVAGENTLCVTAHSVYGCDSEPVCLTKEVCTIVDGFDYSFIGNLVTVSWNGDADSYTIRGDFTDAPFNVESNTYEVLLEEDGEHFILVEPYYINGECLPIMSEFRFVVTNNAPAIQITDVHEGLIATAWNAVDGAIAYNLYRDGEMIAENLTELAYVDTEMALNAQHCYAVQSVFEKGVSDLSEEACANYFDGIGENDAKASVFPNPTTDKVTIQCEGMTMVEVYSADGKLVQRIKVDGDTYQLEGLESGVYTLRIMKGEHNFTRRIVKM
jgi:subtilisin family serine protease